MLKRKVKTKACIANAKEVRVDIESEIANGGTVSAMYYLSSKVTDKIDLFIGGCQMDVPAEAVQAAVFFKRDDGTEFSLKDFIDDVELLADDYRCWLDRDIIAQEDRAEMRNWALED